MTEFFYNISFPFIGTIPLTISNIINIFGIIASLCASIIAIVISVKTLKQNSKMIEDSSRPYITIYGAGVYINSPDYYLILKNFGQSSAYITSFTSDFDLKNGTVKKSSDKPFQCLVGSTIVPGQMFRALIDYNKTVAQTQVINFHISYSSGTHKYEEDICLNLLANTGNFVTHHIKKGEELISISETLQELNMHNL